MDFESTMEIINKAFLTVAEVADLIGLGRSMTYRLVKEGKIPYVRFGKTRGLRVPSAGLRTWIEAREADSAKDDATGGGQRR